VDVIDKLRAYTLRQQRQRSADSQRGAALDKRRGWRLVAKNYKGDGGGDDNALTRAVMARRMSERAFDGDSDGDGGGDGVGGGGNKASMLVHPRTVSAVADDENAYNGGGTRTRRRYVISTRGCRRSHTSGVLVAADDC
jgi:hypothetical protein